MSSPVQILFLSSARTWRGGENQLSFLIQGCSRGNYEVCLGCPRDSMLAMRVGGAPSVRLLNWNFRSEIPLLLKASLREVRSISVPDIIHANDAHAHAAGLMLKKLWNGTPKLVVARRVSFAPKRHFWNRRKYGPDVDCFICVSSTIGEQLKQFGIPAARIQVVHSAVNLTVYEQARPLDVVREFGVPPERMAIGIVGALEKQKDHRTFLQAAAQILKKRSDVHFLIVGEGSLRNDLMSLSEKLCIQAHVTFTGFRSDVPAVMKTLKVCVFTSAEGEGSPGAVKEAMASRVPLVASDEANVREIVANEKSALLAGSGDAEGFARQIGRLLEDDTLQTRICEEAFKRVQTFSVESLIERTERIFNELLNS